MRDRPADAVGDQPGRLAAQLVHIARRHQAHVEQEEAQHALEQVDRERRHHGLACLAGDQADSHGAEQQQLRAIGEALVQDLAKRRVLAAAGLNRAARDPHLLLPQHVGKQHRHDDRRRLHQRHRRRHVRAKGLPVVFQVLRGGDEGHRAHRAIGRRHRCGVKTADHPAQQVVADQRDDDREQDGGAQADGDLRRQARLVERKAAFQAKCHEQVQRQEAGDRLRDLQVGSRETREDAEDEEQDGRVEEVLHRVLWWRGGAMIGACVQS